MGSTSRPDGTANPDGTGGPVRPEDVRVHWHRSDDGGQVVLAAESGRVRVAVAFPESLSRADLEAVLAERDRELGHYFERRAAGDGSGPE